MTSDVAQSRVRRSSRARFRTRLGARRAAALAVIAGVPPLLTAQACGGAGEGGDEGARLPQRSAAAVMAAADVPDFDGDAAWALLKRQVAFGPRVPGTAGHAAQLDWMVDRLRGLADTVWTQPFTHVTGDDRRVRMTNVLARFRADARDRVLLLAHWDTRPTAEGDPDPDRRDEPIPGANDGASGVAVLLQLAEMLAAQPPPIGVDLLLTDGEDWASGEMYLGAKHFAGNLPEGYAPLYGILLDMVGDTDPVFAPEGNSVHYAPEVVQRVWGTAEEIGYGHVFRRDGSGTTVEDDHIPLNRAGIRTIDIIDFDYGPDNRYWHTHQDDVQNTSPRGLKAVGQVVATLVYRGG